MTIEDNKKRYYPGMTVILIDMKGEPQMPKGMEGTIQFVDDIGQIHVNWQNGSTLALNTDEDLFQIKI